MNSTNVTPEHQPRSRRSSSQTVIIVITAVIGGVVLLGAILALVLSLATSSAASDQTLTADTAGVSNLDVDVSTGQFTLEFADVPEATLEVENAAGEWKVQRDGDSLLVHNSTRFWFSSCFIWCEPQVAVLTLPSDLEESGDLEGSLTLSAGQLRASGEFERLHLELSAGELTFHGSAASISGDVSAGELNGTISDVREGALAVSAGSANLRIEGSAPTLLDVNVSAGSVDLTVPDVEYRVDAEVSAGKVDNDLRTRSTSSHHIRVEVSAGSVSLRN